MTKAQNLTLKVSVSVLILAVIFWQVPFAPILSEVLGADKGLVAFGFAFSVVIRWFMASRTRILADPQGLEIGTYKLLEISFIASFYSLFLPGSLSAGAVRWHKISKAAAGEKKTAAFSTIVFDRYVDTIVVVMIGLVCLALDLMSQQNQADLVQLAGVTVVIGVSYLLAFSRISYSLLQHAVGLVPENFERVRELLRKLVESGAVYATLPLSAHLKLVTLSLAKDVGAVMSFFLFALAIDLDLSIITIIWARSAMVLAIMLPISIAGLGVRESSFIGLLAPYGVTPTEAIAYSLLIFASTVGLAVIGGLFEARDVLFKPAATNESDLSVANSQQDGDSAANSTLHSPRRGAPESQADY